MTLNEVKDLAIQCRAMQLEAAEAKEVKAQKARLRYALEKQDEEAEKQYNFEHRLGYCPHCFGLLRLNGTCDNCD